MSTGRVRTQETADDQICRALALTHEPTLSRIDDMGERKKWSNTHGANCGGKHATAKRLADIFRNLTA